MRTKHLSISISISTVASSRKSTGHSRIYLGVNMPRIVPVVGSGCIPAPPHPCCPPSNLPRLMEEPSPRLAKVAPRLGFLPFESPTQLIPFPDLRWEQRRPGGVADCPEKLHLLMSACSASSATERHPHLGLIRLATTMTSLRLAGDFIWAPDPIVMATSFSVRVWQICPKKSGESVPLARPPPPGLGCHCLTALLLCAAPSTDKTWQLTNTRDLP